MTNLNIPFQIPGYRIVRRLGVGGMATVYLAVQESLKRPVAVKVLAAERAPSDELARRFEHEARTIARLDHPHIVSIYDVGRTSTGQIYYTMPYFPNGDLSMRNLRDQPKRVLEVMRALTEALACAHDKGIVHRDVKPENVLFDKQDRPQLADFGIALSHSHQPRMTREGATIGSSGYMSPEQARGQPLDGRSDFYSLGVVCYELLTGERPFQGADALAVALAHIEKPVPRLPVTRRLWQPLVDRALAKQPDARFQSAEELLAAISVVERRLKMRRRRGASRYWVWLVERMLSVSRGKRALALGLVLAVILAALLALLPHVPQMASAPTAASSNEESTLKGADVAAAGESAAAAADTGPESAVSVVGGAMPAAGTAAVAAEAMTSTDRSEQLRRAASLVVAGHLTSPAGNNASERYLALLAADGHDSDAVNGIGRILAALSLRAANAIAEGDPRSAIEPVAQANMLAERARMKASPAFAAFVAPIHDAVRNRRARSRDPFDLSIAAMSPLVPVLERIDAEQARALKADVDRPAELLRSGGHFRDAGGFTLAVITHGGADGARIDHPFAMAATDVTRGAYAKFAAASGRTASPCRESQGLLARLARGVDWRAPGFSQTDEHPVVCVSWDDADAYAQWLGRRFGAHYRLPTSQEWLLAAQAAGTGTGCRKANIDHGNKCDDGYRHTAPVGRFAATTPGLYDVAGNVSVWVDGCAKGAGGAGCSTRTFRGLSWNDDGDESNLARKDTAASGTGYANVGFRLVRDLPSVKD